MILYFANRYMEIIGQASTELPEGLTIEEDLKTEDVETGVAIFECRIPFNNAMRNKVETCAEVGNYILRSDDTENEFYTIIDAEIDTKNQEAWIYAEDAGLDLINEIVGAYEADQAYPISHYINKYALDSGFEIGTNEAPDLTRKLSWDGEATVTERLASVATQFDGCEVSYSYAIKGLTITNKYINIHKKRGKDIGVQLRLNKEIDRIITKKSIANLATALQCTGGMPEESEIPITLEGYSYDDGDFYVDGDKVKSRNAVAKWSRYVWNKEPNKLDGYHGHIVQQYSYDTTSQATLCARAITELKKRCEIEVNYEVEVTEFPANVRIGDRVNVIDDAGELYLSTRLLKLEKSVTENKYTATFGEYLIKGSGIAQKVQDLASQFAQFSYSAENVIKIAEEAKNQADDAQQKAEEAEKEASNAQQKAEEAEQAVSGATQAATQATQKAEAAQAKAEAVEKSVSGLEETITNAQNAAQQATQAANTATQKAEEAKNAADNAANGIQGAIDKAEEAKEKADGVYGLAEEAKSTAATAKEKADEAYSTAAGAKADAEKAEEEIDKFASELESATKTMKAEYARKTDLTEAKASLQTQITQNAAEISSTAKKVQTIDETANDAQKQLIGALEWVEKAQEQADLTRAQAEEAQEAADEARMAADAVQAEADTAQAAADTAQSVADEAEAALKAAIADLETLEERADATDEEIAAAQAAVEQAQAAATNAQAEAESAAQVAKEAQQAAESAVINADKAQAEANAAADKADLAQQALAKAEIDAEEAQEKADEATLAATNAQNAANSAKASAEQAQTTANEAAKAAEQAQKDAAEAKAKSDEAAADLAIAQQKLADVRANASSTTAEIQAAETDVSRAQSAANSAATEASRAQTAANTARAEANTAQANADNARGQANEAQEAANIAQQAANDAKAAVYGLAYRVMDAETEIRQNAEELELAAKKTEVAEMLGGYSTTDEMLAAITLEADKVKTEVSNTHATKEELEEQSTAITSTSEAIIFEALKAYTETGDFEAFKEATEAQLQLLSNELTLKFTETTTRLETVNSELQEQLNTVTKYFTFDINGLTIGQVDNPNKVQIDNDEIKILVNKKAVQVFDADGNAKIPELEVTEGLKLLGLYIEKDESNNINCDWVDHSLYIVRHPQPMTGRSGQTVRFTIEAEGAAMYEWRRLLPGASAWSGMITTKNNYRDVVCGDTPDGTLHRCTVYDKNGNSIISESALLTVV